MRNPRTHATWLVQRLLTHSCRDTWGFSTIASRWVAYPGFGPNTVNSTLKVSIMWVILVWFIQCSYNAVVCYKMSLAIRSPFHAVYWFQLCCRRYANEISFSARRTCCLRHVSNGKFVGKSGVNDVFRQEYCFCRSAVRTRNRLCLWSLGCLPPVTKWLRHTRPFEPFSRSLRNLDKTLKWEIWCRGFENTSASSTI